MAGGFSNQPKLLKGAFVDSNLLAFPPLIVPFQFNPDRLTRRRSTRIQSPRSRRGLEEDLPEEEALGEAQTTLTEPETITMDIRLDAADAMEAGDPIAGEFGVLPCAGLYAEIVTGGIVGIGDAVGITRT